MSFESGATLPLRTILRHDPGVQTVTFRLVHGYTNLEGELFDVLTDVFEDALKRGSISILELRQVAKPPPRKPPFPSDSHNDVRQLGRKVLCGGGEWISSVGQPWKPCDCRRTN